MSHQQIREAATHHGVTQTEIRRWLRLAQAAREPQKFLILRDPDGQYRVFDQMAAQQIAAGAD